MVKKQLIILVNGLTGGCGASVLTATLVKKLSKPKKTIIYADSKYSQIVYQKCGMKACDHLITSVDSFVEQLKIKNNMLKKYEYVILDISKFSQSDTQKLYNVANITIFPLIPTEMVEKAIEDIQEFRSNKGEVHHTYILFNYTKLNYNAEIKEKMRKKLDNFRRKNKLHIFETDIGYSKNLENTNKVIDSKNAREAINKLVEFIKDIKNS